MNCFFPSMQSSCLSVLKRLRLLREALTTHLGSPENSIKCFFFFFPSALSSQHNVCLLALNAVPCFKGSELRSCGSCRRFGTELDPQSPVVSFEFLSLSR